MSKAEDPLVNSANCDLAGVYLGHQTKTSHPSLRFLRCLQF